MTRTTKRIITITAITLGLVVGLVLRHYFRNAPHTLEPGRFSIHDNIVTGSLQGNNLKLTLEAQLNIGNYTHLPTGKGRRIDYISNRVEILESIFGCIDGLRAGSDGEFRISNRNDLETYVQLCQKNLGNPMLNVTPEELAYHEQYSKDRKTFTIHHRDSLISYTCPANGGTGKEHKLTVLRNLASALKIEAYYDFDTFVELENRWSGEKFIGIPTMVEGLPILAVSRDVHQDRDKELYVLQYQEDYSLGGMIIGVTDSDCSVRIEQVVLPLEINSEKIAIISVEEAINALQYKLDQVYIDGILPRIDGTFLISEIRLAYAAVYASVGEYNLVPVYAFIPDLSIRDWDRCIFINAHTGEVYPAIELSYSATGLNPVK